jgi:hypothetical protein
VTAGAGTGLAATFAGRRPWSRGSAAAPEAAGAVAPGGFTPAPLYFGEATFVCVAYPCAPTGAALCSNVSTMRRNSSSSSSSSPSKSSSSSDIAPTHPHTPTHTPTRHQDHVKERAPIRAVVRLCHLSRATQLTHAVGRRWPSTYEHDLMQHAKKWGQAAGPGSDKGLHTHTHTHTHTPQPLSKWMVSFKNLGDELSNINTSSLPRPARQ